MMQKQQQYKENITRLYPTNRPQNEFKKESRQKYQHFKLNLNKTA
jgi:hypothetical protein